VITEIAILKGRLQGTASPAASPAESPAARGSPPGMDKPFFLDPCEEQLRFNNHTLDKIF
jgi:hypothetical protein